MWKLWGAIHFPSILLCLEKNCDRNLQVNHGRRKLTDVSPGNKRRRERDVDAFKSMPINSEWKANESQSALAAAKLIHWGLNWHFPNGHDFFTLLLLFESSCDGNLMPFIHLQGAKSSRNNRDIAFNATNFCPSKNGGETSVTRSWLKIWCPMIKTWFKTLISIYAAYEPLLIEAKKWGNLYSYLWTLRKFWEFHLNSKWGS